MGHRITTQNRGRGGPTYRAPSHRYKAELKHVGDGSKTITGTIIDIEHDPARNAPIARVQLEDSSKVYMLVTEGVGIGEVVSWGTDVEVKNGNTLPLQSIPTGSYYLQHRVSPQRRLASLSARPGSRQSLSIRSATASVCGCPAARPSGLMRAAVQPSGLSPVAAVWKNRL